MQLAGRDVHVAVITDGGRVLGLEPGRQRDGDLYGKLALYCSAMRKALI